MRTCLVVLGDRDQPSPDASQAPQLVHHRVSDLASLPGLLARLPDPPSHVLVVGERRHAALLGRASSMVSAVTGWPVATRALPHGPLAVRRLAAHAAALDLPPTHVVAAFDSAAEGTFSAGWVPGVARLTAPAPSLRQHLRSWFPGGSGFLVEHAPEVRVTAVGAASQDDAAPADRSVPRSVLAVSSTGLPDAALRLAQRLAGTREWVGVPPLEGSAERYGTAAAVELVALPAASPRLPEAGALPSCRVCGLPVLQPACPFCRTSTAPIPLETRS